MSVVVWDGKSVVADKQATCAGLKLTATKIRRVGDGLILAWTGEQDSGEMMANWYVLGQDPAKWPSCQADKDLWCRLVVFHTDGSVETYERQPVPFPMLDAFMAWGSGRDYAMGAMARGATAREAAEIACRFDNGCGMGFDELQLAPQGESHK
jgi:hypothetical protein